MAEFYRFRSMKFLLGRHQELENQTIYFASPEELNDPMEGFRDIVWSGDKIVWTNLFKHYVYCLHRTFLRFRLSGGDKQLDADSIPIFGPWDEFVTSHDKDLFDDIWTRFLNVPKMPAIIDAIANTKRKIRHREMVYYLRVVHVVVFAEILKSHIAHGLMSESKMLQLTEALNDASMIEGLLESIRVAQGAEGKELSEDELLPLERIDNDESIFQQYNSRTISRGILGQNNQFVKFGFVKVYVEQLERLLWPKWYTACFMKSCHNSSAWANYGDNHSGACLIFEAIETDKSKNLKLNQITGKNAKTMPFHEVRYKDKAGEVDFFRSICRLPVSALMKLWYTDREGNISKCAAHIGPDEDAWRKSYWANFFRDITIKTKDWKFEQEYRLILEDGLSQFDDKKDRTLNYDFNSLKGIIFGLKTSDEDKLKIIEIVEEKCRKNNRTDFKLFQAYYSHENGGIRKYEVQLPIRLNPPSGSSEEVFDAEFAFHQGNLQVVLRNIDEAIEDYTRAINLDPNYVEAYKNRGMAYRNKGDYDLAIEDFGKAIQLNPNFAEAYFSRGSIYVKKGDIDHAMEDFSTAIELKPDYAEAYCNRGNAYHRNCEIDCAVANYDKAIELEPDYINAYYNRGTAYVNKADFDLAILDYNRVIGLKPDSADAHFGRGVAYFEKGNYSQAIEDFNKVIELKPDSTDIFSNRGVAHYLKGEYGRAIEDYDKVIELKPYDADAYNNRGAAYSKKGGPEGVSRLAPSVVCAIKDYNAAIGLNPEFALAYFNRGEAWLRLGEWEKAKSDLVIAKQKGINLISAFHDEYKSVPDFEERNGVNLPEDIAEMLTLSPC